MYQLDLWELGKKFYHSNIESNYGLFEINAPDCSIIKSHCVSPVFTFVDAGIFEEFQTLL